MNVRLTDEQAARAEALVEGMMSQPTWGPTVRATPRGKRGLAVAMIAIFAGLDALEARP